MYNWLVFLHVLFALLFMLAHGAHASAMLKFRGEPDPEKSLTFDNILPTSTLIRVLILLMGVPGLIAAFITPWWRQGWPWASLVIFLTISWVMFKYGAGYYDIIFGAAKRLIEAKKTNVNLPAVQKEYDEARNAPHAMIVSVVGIVGLAIIL
jgi:hypothetical protein